MAALEPAPIGLEIASQLLGRLGVSTRKISRLFPMLVALAVALRMLSNALRTLPDALGSTLQLFGEASRVLARHAPLDRSLYLADDAVHCGMDILLNRARVELARAIGGEWRDEGSHSRRLGGRRSLLAFYEEALVGHSRDHFLGFHAVEAVTLEGLVDGHPPAHAFGVLQDGPPDLGEKAARAFLGEAAFRGRGAAFAAGGAAAADAAGVVDAGAAGLCAGTVRSPL